MEKFREYLIGEEKSRSTVEKYMRDVVQFYVWLGERTLTKTMISDWKEEMVEQGLEPGTINGKLAAVNCYLKMIGREDCRVKALKIQRRVFREPRKELTKTEYEQLLRAATRCGRVRLELLMETICATGIRVSELKYITVEAIAVRQAEIRLKGKIRVVLISSKLCRKLSKYCKEQGITDGEIFRTRQGRSLSRKQIWAEMKSICDAAGVEPSKVFPHNLRHLFARCFYKVCRDLVRLADVLGHSSVETTRIYLISTGEEHVRVLDRLKLIS